MPVPAYSGEQAKHTKGRGGGAAAEISEAVALTSPSDFSSVVACLFTLNGSEGSTLRSSTLLKGAAAGLSALAAEST